MAKQFFKDTTRMTKKERLILKRKRRIRVRNTFYKKGLWILLTIQVAYAIWINKEKVLAFFQQIV